VLVAQRGERVDKTGLEDGKVTGGAEVVGARDEADPVEA